MNSNSIFTRRHAGADAAASVSAPATTSAAAEDAFKNDPTATLEGVRGKDVTKAAKALLKDSVKRGGGSIQMRDVVKIYPGSTVHALDDFNLDIKPGEMVVLLGGSGCGQVHRAALARRPRRHPGRPHHGRRPGRHRRAGQQARDGHGVPGLLAFPAHDRPGERGIRPRSARHGQDRTPQDRHGTAGARGTCRSGQEVHAADVRRASNSAWPWPARWPSSRACSC